MGLSKSIAKGKDHSNPSLPQETREKANKQSNSTPKATRKGRNEEPKIIKFRAEISEKETKETIAKINKAKSWFFKKLNKIDKLLA